MSNVIVNQENPNEVTIVESPPVTFEIMATTPSSVNVYNVGIQGPAGPPGESIVGPAGPAGAASTVQGPPGTLVRYGTTAPSNSVGSNGDFYIDTLASFIYGPKDSGAWPTGVSLIGATGPAGTSITGPAGPAGAASTVPGPKGDTGNSGANGVDGKTIRYGSGVPGNGLGVDGDFYINTSTSFIYGPKASGVWPSGISLVGASGPKGDTGDTGPVSTVPGPSGAKGDKGDTGNTGAVSTVPGPSGSNGVDGKTVRNGTTAPINALGVDGDFYLNTSTNFIYGPKASGVWPAGVSLVGPVGPASTVAGPQGPTGPASTVPGPQGVKGDTGSTTYLGILGGSSAANIFPTGTQILGGGAA